MCQGHRVGCLPASTPRRLTPDKAPPRKLEGGATHGDILLEQSFATPVQEAFGLVAYTRQDALRQLGRSGRH